MTRKYRTPLTVLILSAAALAIATPPVLAHGKGKPKPDPITIAEQGSFMVGGSVITGANGDTFHGDHAYVQYQIPEKPRKLPLVMWHGGGQFSKTYESTPDGREGYQSIFLRRDFSTYILDQPRRGRAGRGTVGTTIAAGTPNEASLWGLFRLGPWVPPAAPEFFPNVQFPRDPESLDQYYRQQTPNTGPGAQAVVVDAVAKLFDKIGPAILISHSASGQTSWPTAIASSNVKAIICYETSFYVFPEGEVPPPVPTGLFAVTGTPVPLADFQKLTKIPIQLVFGDNIPTEPSPIPGLDLWRGTLIMARAFVDAINRHGGNAELLHLPTIGVRGNTHFAFSDLNNIKIADLLSSYLKRKGLDKYPGKHDDRDDRDDHRDRDRD